MRCLRFLPALMPAMLALGSGARAETPVHFRTDVMAVLSKAGCNLGGCHGNGSGKAGLKLSLRGQDADLDWLALTRDAGGRRVNPLEPERSLLLLKATGEMPHEGGKRFAAGSPEHAAMLGWLREGAPDSAGAKVTRLEVTPREQVLLEPATSVQLRAVAHFADGTSRDVSRLAVYDPNNLGVTISPAGLVTREKAGETTVMVRYLDKQVPVRLGFVPASPEWTWSEPPVRNFIDTGVFRKLRALRISPSATASDELFVRRAYLDLLGVTPSAGTAQEFTADTSPNKRARLVDRLLERPEFADFWALKWADLLRIEERQLDAKGVTAFHGWIRQSVAENKPLDRFARELVGARGSTYAVPPANWYRANRDPVSRAENTARVFLGTQLNCAQCHNHPFERWTQDDYYDWASLFARVDYEIVENKRGDENDTHEFNGEQIVKLKAEGTVMNPRTGQPATPRFLGAGVPKVTPESDELAQLADWLSHSPLFARMQVNRVWYHLFGRGLVDPVDDFRASNPPSHPEVLDTLARDFAANGYDLRWLIRTIMASETYQLGPDPNPGNAADEANFSRGYVRRLSAEQLIDAAAKVIGAPLEIEGSPAGTRLSQLPGGRKHYKPLTTDLDRFSATFGKPPRLIASDCERSNETAMPQVFQLLSGSLLQGLLTREGNRVSTWAAAEKPVDDMFWSALTRAPSEDERREYEAYIAKAPDRRKAVEDVLWALLNSKEFLFRR